jgi:hypothetical protein
MFVHSDQILCSWANRYRAWTKCSVSDGTTTGHMRVGKLVESARGRCRCRCFWSFHWLSPHLRCKADLCELIVTFTMCVSSGEICTVFRHPALFRTCKAGAEMYEMLVTAYRRHFSCQLCSLTWLELFILYLFPEVRWIIQHFTKKPCNIWERVFEAKGLKYFWTVWYSQQCGLSCGTYHQPVFCVCENISMLRQPAYCLELSLCEFWLFPQIQRTMKGKQFDTIEGIISNMMPCLQVIANAFHKCLQWCQQHWNRCVHVRAYVCVCVCTRTHMPVCQRGVFEGG